MRNVPNMVIRRPKSYKGKITKGFYIRKASNMGNKLVRFHQNQFLKKKISPTMILNNLFKI